MITREQARHLYMVAPRLNVAIKPTELEVDLAETILSLYERLDEQVDDLLCSRRAEQLLTGQEA